MHLWFNGRTLASQAEYAGPIPVACSKPIICSEFSLFFSYKNLYLNIDFVLQ